MFFFVFVCMLLLEPVGLDSLNAALDILYKHVEYADSRAKVTHTLGSNMWCLSFLQHCATRRQYLALSKA